MGAWLHIIRLFPGIRVAKKITFEDRMRRLEKLVEDLEEGELTLEEAVDHYQKGVKLHQELTEHLARLCRRAGIGVSRP